MKHVLAITEELNHIIADASRGMDNIFNAYVVRANTPFIAQSGVYSRGVIKVHIPYTEHSGRVHFAEIDLSVHVRTKAGFNYIYRYKIELPEIDPFEGKADENPLMGNAIWEFYENMRCAADELKKRGTMALYK